MISDSACFYSMFVAWLLLDTLHFFELWRGSIWLFQASVLGASDDWVLFVHVCAVFFSLFIHSFLFPRASETSGLSHQWKPFPKFCWHKAHAVDRNIVTHLLRTGRAAGELVSISCEQMFPGGRLPAWSWFLKKHLLAEKCWFNCVAHIHMMCFPSVSKKKPLKRYLKTYHVDVAWWLRSLWSPWCVVRKHAGSKVWVGRAHVDES